MNVTKMSIILLNIFEWIDDFDDKILVIFLSGGVL